MEQKQKNIFIAIVVIGILFWFLVPFLRLLNFAVFRIGVPILWFASLFSIWTARKDTPIKVLWTVVICFSYLLGPLFWFFWGKRNT